MLFEDRVGVACRHRDAALGLGRNLRTSSKSTSEDLKIRVREGVEVFVEGGEVFGGLFEGGGKVGLFGAGESFGLEGEEKGDFEGEFMGVVMVEVGV